MKRFLAVLLAAAMTLAGSVTAFAAESGEGEMPSLYEMATSEYNPPDQKGKIGFDLTAILDENGTDVSGSLGTYGTNGPDGPGYYSIMLDANKKYYFEITITGLTAEELEACSAWYAGNEFTNRSGDMVYTGELAMDEEDQKNFRQGDKLYIPAYSAFTSGHHGWFGEYRLYARAKLDDDNQITQWFYFTINYGGASLVFSPAEKTMQVGEMLFYQDILRDFPITYYISDRGGNNSDGHTVPYEYLLSKFDDIQWSIGDQSIVKNATAEGSDMITFEAVANGTTELTMTIRNFRDVPFADSRTPETVSGRLTLQVGSAAAEEKAKDDSRDESNHQAEEAAMEAVESAMEAIQSGAANAAAKLQTVTTAAGDTIPAVQVKLYGMGASLSIDSMETMAGASVGLKVSLDGGAAEVLIPGGFALANDPGRVYYPLGYQKNPYNTDVMRSLVKDTDARTEVYKVGGGTLPTTASVTLKTKLAGPVKVYCWNEETRRVTLLANATAENGKVVFATKQLGNLIITTGTI